MPERPVSGPPADDQAAGTDLAEAERFMRDMVAANRDWFLGQDRTRTLMAEYDRRAHEIAALRGENPYAAAVIDRVRAHAGEINDLRVALDLTLAERDEARARVSRVRALHCLDEEMSAATGRDCCKGCATSVTHSRWPCKTIAALDGQEARHA